MTAAVPLAAAPLLTGTWSRTPTPPARLVVVAPHPDDEILGAAGVMCWAARQGSKVEIIAVTDGEASHASSTRIGPDELRRVRAGERTAALAAVGLDVPVTRLGLPDGGITGHERELLAALVDRAEPSCILLAPWRWDGHPDHEAAARVAERAAGVVAASSWQYAVWGKVRRLSELCDQEPRVFRLSPESAALKCAAVGRFASQLVALGPAPEDGPVVNPAELATILDGREQVIL